MQISMSVRTAPSTTATQMPPAQIQRAAIPAHVTVAMQETELSVKVSPFLEFFSLLFIPISLVMV